ncbi:MAG: FliH/SctL family protein [Pseudomonadota bacterium]
MSDTRTDQFKPLTIHSLDSFNDEVSNATKDSEPDFDRFKLLIEKPKFDQEETSDFQALYRGQEEKEEVIFKLLIEKKEKPLQTGRTNEKIASQEMVAQTQEETEPEETSEERGYREGFQNGLAAGTKKGYEEGLDKGFKEGEVKGFEQGRTKGIEEGKTKGMEQGLKQGETKGLEDSKEKVLEIVNSLEDALSKTDQTLEKMVDIYEERIILLIQQIAQKAVMAKIEMDDEVVKPMIIDALKHLIKPEEVVLNVSTEDYEYIEMVKDEFFDQIESLKSVSVRSDPSIKRGGCKIQTKTASVSTDVESRLQTIFNAIQKAGAV